LDVAAFLWLIDRAFQGVFVINTDHALAAAEQPDVAIALAA
jgi:hypothetical protein